MENSTQKGFTIIELLISLAISSIIATALFSFFFFNQKTFENQYQITDMQQNARATINFISKAIINAGYDPMEKGVDAIDPSSDETYIKIHADLNGDGEIPSNDTNEVIIFSFDRKKKIIRNKDRQPIINNIIDLQFTYDPPPPETKQVTVSLTAQTEGIVSGEVKTVTLQADITVRNNL